MLILYIHNMDGKPESTYEYIVKENTEIIAEGIVKHVRGDGWIPLVRRICEQQEEK